MLLIKADLAGLSPEQLADKCHYVETSMTGNANFTAPSPSIAALTAARTALEADIQAANTGDHVAIAARNESARLVRQLLTEEALYVNSASGDDLEKAMTSGFGPVKKRQPIGQLPAPDDLSHRLTDFTGRVDLDWASVKGARLYHVYMSTDINDPTKWELTAVTTKSRLQVDSLDSGTFYWFAVTAIGTAGESARSDVMQARAA